MKKYFVLPLALFAIACNSNTDKISDKAPATTVSADTTSGEGLLSGKFEIVDYKKDNVKVLLPKTFVEFTRKGDYYTADGNQFQYKISGDSISILLNDNYLVTKSGIEFQNTDKTTFILKNPKEKTEYTYQKTNN